MPTVLRNGRTVGEASAMDEKSESEYEQQKRSATPRPSPYLLLVYPLVLAIGSLFALISPIASPPAAPLAAGVASSSQQTNYFAGKRNLVNILFVKRGWLWTSLAFLFLQLTISPLALSARNKQKHYLQSTIRYTLVTLSWILTTQWFFGPALIDRSFTLTGGHCEGLPPNVEEIASGGIDVLEKFTLIHTSTACKAAGGKWRGGHDISGHVFMLVLSSAFLLYELYLADRHHPHPNISPRAAANVAHDMTEEERRAVGGWESENSAKYRIYARYFLYLVVGLDFLMMFTTSVWFHTWLEKLNGMLIAGISLWVTYFLGDFIGGWRNIVGGM